MLEVREVIEFIYDFKKSNIPVITDLFTQGYCYYFALMLSDRFGGEIMISEKENHFCCQIKVSVANYEISECFDINGIIANNRDFVPFSEYEKIDLLRYQRLIRDCVRKSV